MAVDKEMEAVFKSSRSQEVDPVSGNEVPTGSLPEEVRDDIPAQLSEGEYVVPADVVRYYGVRFFEDLRNQAKMGWQEMEANGRIGGEPVAPEGMEMGGDDFPFDLSELKTYDDEAEEQPEMFVGGFVSGYAEGGMVEDTEEDPSKLKALTLDDLNQQAQRISKGALGTVGSRVATMTLGPLAGVATKIGAEHARRNNAYDTIEKINTRLQADDLSDKDRTELINNRTKLEEVVSTGSDNKSDAGLVGKSGVFGGRSGVYEGLKDVAGGDNGGDGRVNFGDTWLGDTLGFDGSVGTDGPGLKDSVGGARRTPSEDKEDEE